ncbi:hypothetical protein CERSUDRAFT_110040 [Gelatoporia subvermispora B]|uniref:Cyclin-like domain-containing protein n=1 Tax=Ceriporiopsis subvermispora (strain B) TaxID=914234 RepID=M2QWK2_CERS8|nr:hypothetical protein CERSUDRAFT_110040 [Gelatoporia subvermispora B]
MALYTPPSLPHTPSFYTMNATLPPLSTDLLSAWQRWRTAKPDLPITPPCSTTLPNLQRRVAHPHPQSSTRLPSIAYLEREISRPSPVIPPRTDDAQYWQDRSPVSLKLPPVLVPQAQPPHLPSHSQLDAVAEQSLPSPAPLKTPSFDWFGGSSERSAEYIAEKTCEMICYLWFSVLSPSSSSSSESQSKRTCTAAHEQSTYFPHSNSATARLQFNVSQQFIRFMQKVLETTQVSQSVIVLSLHYVYRMKARNPYTSGQPGSEYRVAVAALMMANKFVDDNTYTNKTWSEVSGIDLAEINKMEREFLLGIEFGLYVDKSTYDSWLNLLKGLIMAKERESQHYRRSRSSSRLLHCSRAHQSRHSAAHTSRMHSTSHRARSSSPRRSSVDYSALRSAPADYTIPVPQVADTQAVCYPGSKRTATTAFSPAVMSYPTEQRRPSTGLTLQIPQYPHATEKSASPMEPLQSFAKMSLASSPIDDGTAPSWASEVRQDVAPQTLVSAYRADDQRAHAPQNLYFYSLACSPTEEENRSRKGRLRYHQPPPPQPAPTYQYQLPPSMPAVVQSACTSPYDSPVHLPPPTALPSFAEMSRECSPYSHRLNVSDRAVAPQSQQQLMHDGTIQSAPFANAGPPGVQYYSIAVRHASPALYRTRGRGC